MIFSKDYEELYKAICEKKRVVCLAIYEYSADGEQIKDPCYCTREKKFSIEFRSRGIVYGSIKDIHKKEGTEKEVFFKLCSKLSIEYIVKD